jgi:hypothetical protein
LNQQRKERLRGDATDELFARSSGSSVAAWYQTDRLGSVREMLNSTGTISDRVNYDGFGNVTSETAPSVGDRWRSIGTCVRRAFTGSYYNVCCSIQKFCHSAARPFRRVTWHSRGQGFDPPHLHWKCKRVCRGRLVFLWF